MTKILSWSIKAWWRDYWMLSLKSCNKMRPTDKPLWNPWLSWPNCMVKFGAHLFQSSFLLFHRSWRIETSKMQQDNQLSKLSILSLKTWLLLSERTNLIWMSTYSQLLHSWWLSSPTLMILMPGSLRKKLNFRQRLIQLPSLLIVFKDLPSSWVKRQHWCVPQPW